jgi:hypothetical protein
MREMPSVLAGRSHVIVALSIILVYLTAQVHSLYMTTSTAARSAAAQKAAATRRANKANGTTPTSSKRTRGGPAFATPPANYRGQLLVVLAGVEDLFVLKLRDKGITQDARDAYEKYKKVKALALGAASNSATQTEADLALRTAICMLVKLAY